MSICLGTHADAGRSGRDSNLGLALIRDGNGSRAFDTLPRYRGTAPAERRHALRLLEAQQGGRTRAQRGVPVVPVPGPGADAGVAVEKPVEPEGRGNLGEIAPSLVGARAKRKTLPARRGIGGAVRGTAPGAIAAGNAHARAARENPPVPCERPIEPEGRRKPREWALAPDADQPKVRVGPTPALLTTRSTVESVLEECL